MTNSFGHLSLYELRLRQWISQNFSNNLYIHNHTQWFKNYEVQMGQISDFQLGGQRLVIKSNVKYLGVFLDGKLSWKDRMDYATKELMVCIWQLRWVLGRNWGLRSETMNWIYESLLTPRVRYAASVWWDRTNLVNSKRLLHGLRGATFRTFTGADRSTPTAVWEWWWEFKHFSLPSESSHIGPPENKQLKQRESFEIIQLFLYRKRMGLTEDANRQNMS